MINNGATSFSQKSSRNQGHGLKAPGEHIESALPAIVTVNADMPVGRSKDFGWCEHRDGNGVRQS
jgi:hypothetical protein